MNDNDRNRRPSRRRGHSRGGRPQGENQPGAAKQGERPDISARVEAERAQSDRGRRRDGGRSDGGRSDGGRNAGSDGRRDGRQRQQSAPSIADRGFDRSSDVSKKRAFFPDRPRWIAPKQGPVVLPRPECRYCGKPIEDLSSAITDKETGTPVHFDCVLTRLGEVEHLCEGEKVIYIGGGRFGVVRFTDPQDPKTFKIQKILQWEDKEKRSDWRRDITEKYSST